MTGNKVKKRRTSYGKIPCPEFEEKEKPEVVGKDKVVAGKDKVVAGKDKVVAGKDKVVAGKDKVVAGKDKTRPRKSSEEDLKNQSASTPSGILKTIVSFVGFMVKGLFALILLGLMLNLAFGVINKYVFGGKLQNYVTLVSYKDFFGGR